MEKEIRAILWLQYVAALPATHVVALWRHFDNFERALRADESDLAQIVPAKYLKPLLRKRVHLNLDHALPQEQVSDGVVLLPLGAPDYPRLLSDIHTPPPLLHVHGNIALLSVPQIAIIGTRRPTPAGACIARRFATELTEAGFTVTSGLAYGIDISAHQGAMEAGSTVAVLATGVNPVYPAKHQKLADNIVNRGGVLLSEMPAGTPPLPAYFPQRNRIISGLCLGVLVVEATRKSGTLITVRQALEQGREVFAVPGPVQSEVSRGCHQMIRDGATLVETTRDIIDQLGAMVEYKREELRGPLSEPLSSSEQELLENVGFDTLDFDGLVERTGMATPELTSALLELELKGLLQQSAGGYQRVR